METAAPRHLAGMDVPKKMLVVVVRREGDERLDPEGDSALGGLAATGAGGRGGHGIDRPVEAAQYTVVVSLAKIGSVNVILSLYQHRRGCADGNRRLLHAHPERR